MHMSAFKIEEEKVNKIGEIEKGEARKAPSPVKKLDRNRTGEILHFVRKS